MKYVAVVLMCCVAFVASEGLLSPEEKAKILELHKACMAETKLDPEVAKKAQTGEYVDDPKLKEQLLCFNKKAGAQNEAGVLQMDYIKSKLMGLVKNEKLVNEILTKCAVQKDSPQETAFGLMKCLHGYAPKEDMTMN